MVVNPMGRSGRLLLGWADGVVIHQVRKLSFCMEVEFETRKTKGNMWAIFVYASNKGTERAEQWEELCRRKRDWGDNWFLGGDFNKIRSPLEKKGGRSRSVESCKGFQDFIQHMNMEEKGVQGNQTTWSNNWRGERYIAARLDRFFGAAKWLVDNEKAVVKHIERYSSYHSMLLLDTKPDMEKKKKRFYFDKRWVDKPGIEEVIRKAWEPEGIGSPMFKVGQKIKQCRMALIEWNK